MLNGVEETVYLRRHVDGWSVSLDEAPLLSTADEELAFRYACAACRRPEDGGVRPLLILSGPAAAADVPAAHRRAILAAE